MLLKRTPTRGGAARTFSSSLGAECAMRCPLVTRQRAAGAMQSLCRRSHDCLEAEDPAGQSLAAEINVHPQGGAPWVSSLCLLQSSNECNGCVRIDTRRKNLCPKEHGHQFALATPGGKNRKDFLFAFPLYFKGKCR